MTSFFAAHQHVLAYLTLGIRTCFWLVVFTVIFAPLEHFFAVRPVKFFHKSWLTNLGWYFVASIVPAFLLGPPSALIAMAVHAILPAEVTGAAAGLPLWARMVAAMVVGEVGFYWGHRWSHEIPLLWRFHAIHHSATEMTFLVNSRAHPVDAVFTRLCGLVLLYATGLASPVGHNPGLVPTLVLLIGSGWSYFIHANLRWRLGPFEEVISSPAFHHWHHTLDDHRDHNYSAMVPVIDRIFGTFYLPREWPAEYGTDTPVPDALVDQLLAPFGPPQKTSRPNTEVGAAKS